MKKYLAITGLLLASACEVPLDIEPIPPAGGGSCNVAAAQALVGRFASTGLGREALQRSGATALRWIGPDTAVTMDYRVDRINLELNSNNQVKRVTCG